MALLIRILAKNGTFQTYFGLIFDFFLKMPFQEFLAKNIYFQAIFSLKMALFMLI
jgi:hypothetical protein